MKISTDEIHYKSKTDVFVSSFTLFNKNSIFRNGLYIKEKVLAHHTSNICKEWHEMTKNYDYNF